MIIDKNLMVSYPQVLTVTAPSTDVIDLQNARNLGGGNQGSALPAILCLVAVAFAGGTSLQVQLQTSPDNLTWTTEVETPAIPLAQLTLGARLAKFQLPDYSVKQRYLRLNYVIVGTMSGGSAVNAGIVLNPDDVNEGGLYPSGFTVSN